MYSYKAKMSSNVSEVQALIVPCPPLRLGSFTLSIIDQNLCIFQLVQKTLSLRFVVKSLSLPVLDIPIGRQHATIRLNLAGTQGGDLGIPVGKVAPQSSCLAAPGSLGGELGIGGRELISKAVGPQARGVKFVFLSAVVVGAYSGDLRIELLHLEGAAGGALAAQRVDFTVHGLDPGLLVG